MCRIKTARSGVASECNYAWAPSPSGATPPRKLLAFHGENDNGSPASLAPEILQRWFGPNSVAREPELSGRLLHALRDADAESYALCCEALAAYDVHDRLGELGMPVVAQAAPFGSVGTIGTVHFEGQGPAGACRWP